MKAKKLVLMLDVIIVAIITMAIISGTVFQETFKVQTQNLFSENANLSFDLKASPEETRVKAGETVEITLSLDKINVGENGLNSIVGYLGYNESLFDSMEFYGVGEKNQNTARTNSEDNGETAKANWNVELNQIRNHKLFGKFCIYTMQEGVTENQDIAKVVLKLKDDLKPQTTRVTFTNLASSDGDVEVPEEDREVVIIIYEDEPGTEIKESAIKVKHLEKVAKKITEQEVDEKTGEIKEVKKEILVAEPILGVDDEYITGEVGESEKTQRKEIQGFIPSSPIESQGVSVNVINANKEQNEITATYKENTVAEVIYWYERDYKITTDVVEHEEEVTNAETGEKKTIMVKGGSITGELTPENTKPIEEVLRGSDSTKPIVIKPDEGYIIKKVTIKDGNKETYEISVSQFMQEDSKTAIIPKGYFEDVQADKHVEVEFELIPQTPPQEEVKKSAIKVKHLEKVAKKITEQEVDEKTGEIKEVKKEILVAEHIAGVDDEYITGEVGESEKTKRKEIQGFIPSSPIESQGVSVNVINANKEQNEITATYKENTVVEVIYWYERDYKITTDVVEHEEEVTNTETGEKKTIMVKGGSITGELTPENTKPVEEVLRGSDSTKPIVIKPDEGYIIKKVTIKDGNKEAYEIIVSQFMQEDGKTAIIPKGYFEDMQADKLVEVEFEFIEGDSKPGDDKLEEDKPDNKPQDKPTQPQTGDTKIIAIIVTLTLTIILNILTFAKKGNAKLLSSILVLIIGISCFGVMSYATENEIDITEVINRLSVKQSWLNSSEYLVTKDNISRIAPGAEMSAVAKKFNKSIEINPNGTTADEGKIATGMKVRVRNSSVKDADGDSIYEVSVWGDTNGDGKSNQVELTTIIRSTLDSRKWNLNGTKFISADIKVDGNINEEDVQKSVRYIVYEEMEIPSFEPVKEPQIEIIAGEYSEETESYTGGVQVKVVEKEIDATNTYIKVENSEGVVEEFKAIERFAKNKDNEYENVITLVESDVYKISAYTTGKLGNRSEIPYEIIHIEQESTVYTVDGYVKVGNGTGVVTDESEDGGIIETVPMQVVEGGSYNGTIKPATGYKVVGIRVYSGDEIDGGYDATNGIAYVVGKKKNKAISISNITENKFIVATVEKGKVVAQIVAVPGDDEYLAQIQSKVDGLPVLNHTYYTIEEALKDAENVNSEKGNIIGKVEIQLIYIEGEENIIEEGANEVVTGNEIILDLNGCKVVASDIEEPIISIKQGATLQVIDKSDVQTGAIINTATKEKAEQADGMSVAIKIDNGGELTLGDNDGPLSVKEESPKIQGGTYGIYKEPSEEGNEGTFNYYDGTIIGEASARGGSIIVNDTPTLYDIHESPVTDEDGKTSVVDVLKRDSQYEAMVGGAKYYKVQQAFKDINDGIYGNGPVEVDLLKNSTLSPSDFTDGSVSNQIIINSGKKVIFDLNGFTVTNNLSVEGIVNKGSLEIKDSTVNCKTEIQGTLHKYSEDDEYYFEKVGNYIESNNSQEKDTEAYGYIELDLTDRPEDETYELFISGQLIGKCWIDVNETAEKPEEYSFNKQETSADNTFGGTLNQIGKKEDNLSGGKKYYIHLRYLCLNRGILGINEKLSISQVILTNTKTFERHIVMDNLIDAKGGIERYGEVLLDHILYPMNQDSGFALNEIYNRVTSIVNKEGANLKISNIWISNTKAIVNYGTLEVKDSFVTGIIETIGNDDTETKIESSVVGHIQNGSKDNEKNPKLRVIEDSKVLHKIELYGTIDFENTRFYRYVKVSGEDTVKIKNVDIEGIISLIGGEIRLDNVEGYELRVSNAQGSINRLTATLGDDGVYISNSTLNIENGNFAHGVANAIALTVAGGSTVSIDNTIIDGQVNITNSTVNANNIEVTKNGVVVDSNSTFNLNSGTINSKGIRYKQ